VAVLVVDAMVISSSAASSSRRHGDWGVSGGVCCWGAKCGKGGEAWKRGGLELFRRSR
jgi:hypothetical protein